MANMGNLGRFSERLKKIARNRRNRNKEVLEDSKYIYRNFLSVMAAIPGYVYENIRTPDDKQKKEILIKKDNKKINKKYYKVVKKEDLKAEKKEKFDRVEENIKNNIKDAVDQSRGVEGSIRIPEESKVITRETNKLEKIKNKNIIRGILARKATHKEIEAKPVSEEIKNTKDDDRIKKLEKDIIKSIQKNLLKTKNELEMIQSELYILSEINGDSLTVEKCKEEIEKTKRLLKRIEELKAKYDYLKDNYDFEYLLDVGDNALVDKLIELRDEFGKGELKVVTEDYKLLDIYKSLYLEIDHLQDKTIEFDKEKEKQKKELEERDIDFEDLKSNVYNVDKVNEKYQFFIKEQNELLKKIGEEIGKIDSHEVVHYNLVGFSRLFGQSLKFMGLMMLSPLRGIIPAIATETAITGNLIRNLRKNVHYEEHRRMVYETTDFTSDVRSAINNLDMASQMIDSTLDEIVHLKMEYNDEFKKYQGDFDEYRDIMKKIGKIEHEMVNNKIKIEMMKKVAKTQEKENVKKLELVNKLNSEEQKNS